MGENSRIQKQSVYPAIAAIAMESVLGKISCGAGDSDKPLVIIHRLFSPSTRDGMMRSSDPKVPPNHWLVGG
jgi:hypothetical protein